MTIAYKDPKHHGNGKKYRTGKPCITEGCGMPAGTAWSPFWCFLCNVKRLDRINANMEDIRKHFSQGRSRS